MSEKIYPTAPDEQGFYFANDVDENYGIKTKEEGKSLIKQLELPRSKKIAVVKALKARDMAAVTRYAKESERYMYAVATVATTIDGQPVVIEEIEGLWLADYQRLVIAVSGLNF